MIQATVHCGRFRTETDIVDDRLIEGSIVDQIDETMDFLKKHTNVRFIITGKPRRDQLWDYPLEALRGAVVNAVCHRDYGDTADIQIKVFDDHILIWNPGFLPYGVTIEDLYRRTHASKPRNKLIAQVLYDLEIIERYGSGIQRMLDACRAAGIPEPTMAESTGGFLITFRGAKGGAAGPSTVKAGAESAPSSRQVTGEVTGEVVRLLHVMQGEMQRQEIQNVLHLRHEDYFRAAYLVPALKAQLIEMTIPDKPRSSKQRYRLTEKGRAWLRSRPGRNLNDRGTAGRVGP
ncbi:MAG: hypothetical protein GX616_24580 [Planctomycetes bacterium]|nr:hypothetical protein [Planctomycetota bacterium]